MQALLLPDTRSRKKMQETEDRSQESEFEMLQDVRSMMPVQELEKEPMVVSCILYLESCIKS